MQVNGRFKNFSILLFIAIALNYDWRINGILWWGSVAILLLSFCVGNGGKLQLHIRGYFSWMIGFFALCLFSLTYALSIEMAVNVIKSLVVWTVALLLIDSDLQKGNEHITNFLRLYMIAVCINALYLVFTMDLSNFGKVMIGVATNERWNGNGIGFMMTSGSLIAMYLLHLPENAKKKAVYYIIIVGLALVSLFTGSRTAFVMLLGGVSLFILLRQPKKMVRNVVLVSLTIIIAYSAIMNIPSLYSILGVRVEQLINLFSGNGTVDSSAILREKFIENGIIWFKDKPLFGHGINCYSALNGMATGRYTYAHNNFIEMAVDLGIVGFIYYYAAYVYLFVKLIKNYKNNVYIAFLLAVLTVVTISQYGTISYYDLFTNALLMLCFNVVRREKNEGDEYAKNSYRKSGICHY